MTPELRAALDAAKAEAAENCEEGAASALDALDALIAAVEQAHQWQPMETAPKKGVILIRERDGYITSAFWLRGQWVPLDGLRRRCEPTGWMPAHDA